LFSPFAAGHDPSGFEHSGARAIPRARQATKIALRASRLVLCLRNTYWRTKVTTRFALLTMILFSGIAQAQRSNEVIAAVNEVLDDFHDAAAHGDKARYLDQMTDNAVFMGTDESERWPLHPEFAQYVDAHFADGHGWTYEPVDRHVTIDEGGEIAWFDEVVFSETNGRFRGTGVLVREGARWKIAHYALSFLIHNEDWDAVIELTRRSAASNAQGND